MSEASNWYLDDADQTHSRVFFWICTGTYVEDCRVRLYGNPPHERRTCVPGCRTYLRSNRLDWTCKRVCCFQHRLSIFIPHRPKEGLHRNLNRRFRSCTWVTLQGSRAFALRGCNCISGVSNCLAASEQAFTVCVWYQDRSFGSLLQPENIFKIVHWPKISFGYSSTCRSGTLLQPSQSFARQFWR